MTRKFAHPISTFASAGHITSRQQLSFDNGVIRSEGKARGHTTSVARSESLI